MAQLAYPAARPARSGVLLPLILGLLLALLLGLVAGSGSLLLALMFGGALVGAFLLARPDAMLWLLLATVLVLSGTVQFFADFHQLQWIASLLGMALLAVGLYQQLGSRPLPASPAGPSIGVVAGLFLLMLAVSSAVNAVPPDQLIVGLRAYLPFWGVFAVLAAARLDEHQVRALLLAMLAVAALQWPLALYQKIFVVPERIALNYFGSAFDSVVGTFGGPKFGGGASGSLGVFLALMLVFAGALWHRRQLTTRWFALLFLTIGVAMGLTETKVVFMLVPLGMLWVFRDGLVRRPVAFVLGSAAVLVLLAGVLFSYYKLYWEDSGRGDFWDVIGRRFAYSFDPNFMATADWPGRIAGLLIWNRHHELASEPFTTLLGHGAAAATTFSTFMGPSAASRRYGLGLDVTGATKLLWDSGALGFLLFLALFGTGFVIAGRLLRDARIPDWHRAALNGAQTAMPLLALALFYEVTSVSSPPVQFLAMFLLGYIAYWQRRLRQAA
ncbi:MAG: hypothetical protein AMXMBFR6_02110 [Betaproteobacteria bacterium]